MHAARYDEDMEYQRSEMRASDGLNERDNEMPNYGNWRTHERHERWRRECQALEHRTRSDRLSPSWSILAVIVSTPLLFVPYRCCSSPFQIFLFIDSGGVVHYHSCVMGTLRCEKWSILRFVTISTSGLLASRLSLTESTASQKRRHRPSRITIHPIACTHQIH